MPRLARRESGTGYCHAMVRGANRESLFKGGMDKELFMELLKKSQQAQPYRASVWEQVQELMHRG